MRKRKSSLISEIYFYPPFKVLLETQCVSCMKKRDGLITFNEIWVRNWKFIRSSKSSGGRVLPKQHITAKRQSFRNVAMKALVLQKEIYDMEDVVKKTWKGPTNLQRSRYLKYLALCFRLLPKFHSLTLYNSCVYMSYVASFNDGLAVITPVTSPKYFQHVFTQKSTCVISQSGRV